MRDAHRWSPDHDPTARSIDTCVRCSTTGYGPICDKHRDELAVAATTDNGGDA